MTFDGPARAIHCAQSIITALRFLEMPIRIGIHTGEVEIADDDIRGIAVHITSRVAGLGVPTILSSRARSGILWRAPVSRFEDFGTHLLKGACACGARLSTLRRRIENKGRLPAALSFLVARFDDACLVAEFVGIPATDDYLYLRCDTSWAGRGPAACRGCRSRISSFNFVRAIVSWSMASPQVHPTMNCGLQ